MPKLCRLFAVGAIDQPRGAGSALFRHRGWLSEIGVLFFSLQLILKRRIKKKDEIEKEGLEKRNRENIDTYFRQPFSMPPFLSNIFIIFDTCINTYLHTKMYIKK